MKAKNLFLFFVATVFSLVGFTPKAHADGPYRFGALYYYLNKPYNGTATVTHDIRAERSFSIIHDHVVYDDNYTGLYEITIPSSFVFSGDGKTYHVVSIEENAFNCSDVERVNIPTSVTSIGEGAFFRSALYKNSDNWFEGGLYVSNCLIEVDEDDVPYYGRFKLKSGTRLIADYCFCPSFEKNTKVTYIDLNSQDLKYIGDHAIAECTNLTKVDGLLKNNITRVDRWAFADCPNLTSVVNMANAEYIGNGAFDGCSSLKSFSLPNNEKFTTIPRNLFKGCSSLKSITFPRYITQIEDRAFAECTALREITCHSKIKLKGGPFRNLKKILYHGDYSEALFKLLYRELEGI